MKKKKLIILLALGLLLLSASVAFGASRLIQPYDNPQGIYEDNDIRIQMDVDADFHISLLVTNKTNSATLLYFKRATVFYTGTAYPSAVRESNDQEDELADVARTAEAR